MNHYEDIKKIANYYGFEKQGNKLAEEASELAAAMNKLLAGEGSREAVVEEMADTIIMIKQMLYLMGVKGNELIEMTNKKIKRQLKRMSM